MMTSASLIRFEATEPEAIALVRVYDDDPNGKLDRIEFATLVRDLERDLVSDLEGLPCKCSRRRPHPSPHRCAISRAGSCGARGVTAEDKVLPHKLTRGPC